MLAIARVLAWRASWSTGVSRPTRAATAEAVGCSERTVTRWWGWLEEQQLVRILEPGSLAQFRPGILYKDEGPLAKELLLTLPGESFVAPSQGPVDPSRARETEPDGSGENPAPTGTVALAKEVRRVSLTARRVRVTTLAGLLAPLADAEWSPDCVLYALDHLPDGTPHRHTDEVRHAYGWMRNRLTLWLDGEGRPVPGRRAQLEERAVVHRAEVAAARPPTGPGCDPAVAAGWAEQARGMLSAKLARPVRRPGRPGTG